MGDLTAIKDGSDPAAMDRLRSALAAQMEDQDGRYVVLCDDGSVITTDDLMDGDDVLVDRGTD